MLSTKTTKKKENGVGRHYLTTDSQLFFDLIKRQWVTEHDKKIRFYDHIKAGEYGNDISIDDYCKVFDCEWLYWC